MKSIHSKHRYSFKSMLVVMVLMLSGFFGQCMMTVESLAMDHQMTEDSEVGGCDGVCDVEDTNKSEEFALFKTDPPEPEAAVRSFIYKEVELIFLNRSGKIYPARQLVYLPPGTHSEGIRLRT